MANQRSGFRLQAGVVLFLVLFLAKQDQVAAQILVPQVVSGKDAGPSASKFGFTTLFRLVNLSDSAVDVLSSVPIAATVILVEHSTWSAFGTLPAPTGAVG